MRKLFTLAGILLSLNLFAQDWQTYYEKSGYTETPRYAETMQYCWRLNEASPLISIATIGKSTQGRDIEMLIVDKDGLTDPALIRAKGRLVVLVEACIHPGEPDGKDAMLMLLRDMVIQNKYKELLDKASILFIPIFNVDGHERFGPYNRINQNGPKEMGWRTTATNLNLNRDFIKADAPEMRAWLKMYNAWLPDFFIDIHTTDGADYQYQLTYGIEKYGNLDSGLTRWINDIYEPRLVKGMKDEGYKIFPYVEFRNWHDPRSGMEKSAAPPLISHGYAAAQNRPSILVETHMLKDYKTRVSSAYQLTVQTLKIVNQQSETLKTLISMADNSTASPNFRNEPLTVGYKTSSTDSTMVDFQGYDYTIKKSDLTGGDWFVYDPSKPVTMKIPMFDKVTPDKTIKLPLAYIIPVEWTDVIERIALHGIKMMKLETETEIPVNILRFNDYKFQPEPVEGRQMVRTKAIESKESRVFSAGSVIILTNQRTAKIIAYLLEPTATGSLTEWGFFNSLFEQKEYSETYVMEPLARKMLAENPQLKKEFDETIKNNPAYKGKQWEMLNWFYSHTPYWDKNCRAFPVGRIMDQSTLNQLKLTDY